ncbi:MAG: hypothetical protein AB7T06_43370 [Kofleriaceae bacterium]
MLRLFSVLVIVLGSACIVGEEGAPTVPGADDDGSGSATPDGGSETPLVDPCSETCAGVPRDNELNVTNGEYGGADAQRWATCFSCRCKSALVELPRPEELTCSSAAGPLARWRPTRDATTGAITGVVQIDPNGTDTTDCMNPGMAAAGCDLQARFKRILTNNGQTEYQQLCRKRNTGETGYYEYLIIGHNQQNGATCFWQARDSTFDGETIPKLDLSAASADDKKQYAETFYQYSAGPSTCTNCHATDAFLTSPYLSSAWSLQQANADPMTRSRISPSKPYKLVTADQEQPQPIVHEEVTGQGKPLQAACGGCHKVTKGQYCGFAVKSVAEQRIAMTDADVNILRAQAMPFTYWMPPGGTQSHAQTMTLQQQVRDACGL